MKQLNFTCKEILPSLLDKSKTQTIRKGWDIRKCYPVNSASCGDNSLFHQIIEKPAKYKVGDEVELVWDRDSKYEWFRLNDGTAHKGSLKYHLSDSKLGYAGLFNKNLGKVKITEVFQIEMRKCGFSMKGKDYNFLTNATLMIFKPFINLAKTNGFKSMEKMFTYFDKNYDLSQPKKFWVYRWVWPRQKND